MQQLSAILNEVTIQLHLMWKGALRARPSPHLFLTRIRWSRANKLFLALDPEVLAACGVRVVPNRAGVRLSSGPPISRTRPTGPPVAGVS